MVLLEAKLRSKRIKSNLRTIEMQVLVKSYSLEERPQKSDFQDVNVLIKFLPKMRAYMHVAWIAYVHVLSAKIDFNPRRGSLCLLRNVAAEVESNMYA